jgi:hypothetical protein
MSWDIFKQNILNVANNPNGIPDIDTVARAYALEYDAAIKRGHDTINNISVKQGNIDLMQSLFKSALLQGQSSTVPFDLVGEMGKGVLGYWQGATLNEFPIPIIPAAGSVVNVSTTSAFCTNSGKWLPAVSVAAAVDGGNPYDKLDWSKIKGLDKNDPDVQRIINPNKNVAAETIFEEAIAAEDYQFVAAADGQLNTIKDEIINKALREQGLVENTVNEKDLKSGYNSLDELLRKASAWARKLNKNPRVKYENLIQGYNSLVHGLCPQGAQSVIAALTGIGELGSLHGHADWFSFKRPGTYYDGGGYPSFAAPIGGKVYYNDKVHIDSSYTLNPAKWQVGDIVVMGYTGGMPYGHIQVWTGFKWMSDFTQNRIQPNHVDDSTIALWRLNENGKNAVAQNKNKSV